MVWFGHMTHGTFTIGGDENPIVIVNSIDEKAIMDPNDVEEILQNIGYDSYLILDEFEGDIVFSQEFLKGLTNDTY
jgi:hypothetical protein